MEKLGSCEPQSSSEKLSSLFDLKGRVAIVTGGAGWLGAAISEALAELGAHIFIGSRNKEASHKSAQKMAIQFPDTSFDAVSLDVKSKESVSQCFDQVMQKAGRLDILVNNAYSGTAKSLETTSLQEWQDIVDVGLTGYYLCIAEAITHMKKSGGSIINVASMYGIISPNPDVYEGTEFNSSPAYGAAKAGILQLTRYTACNLAKYNIRVNALSPGPFPSPQVRETKPFINALCQKVPMKRIGEPWELKGPVAFLASDASSFVTGQNLVVDGGWTAW